jgi:hypothetical protein
MSFSGELGYPLEVGIHSLLTKALPIRNLQQLEFAAKQWWLGCAGTASLQHINIINI